MRGLKSEWLAQRHLLEGKRIASIYFGGGTPYLIGPKALEEILGWVKELPFETPDIEITLEANPENVTLESMQAYRNAGVNRVSIGVQSLDNSLLKVLGRQHSAHKSLDAIEITSKAGINNISIDLMYDLPNQTLETWVRTLKAVKPLPITHLSLYNLTIEPHTVFFKYRQSLQTLIPDQETSLAMVKAAFEELHKAELIQYEISAFCKNGLYAKHNVGYWTGRPFLGYGPSAFSYWEGRRFRNIANLSKYLAKLDAGQSPVDFEETLQPEAQQRELIAIKLRLFQGIEPDALDDATKGVLENLVVEGFLQHQGRRIALSPKGILFYDDVATELVIESC